MAPRRRRGKAHGARGLLPLHRRLRRQQDRADSFARICGLNAADLLVTDAAITDEQRSSLEAHGLEVRIAGLGATEGPAAMSHNGSESAQSNHGDWSHADD